MHCCEFPYRTTVVWSVALTLLLTGSLGAVSEAVAAESDSAAAPQAAGTAAASAVSWKILPEKVELTGPHASQSLIVERVVAGQFRGDATAHAKFRSADPRVATVDARGTVTPIGDGETTITAEVAGQTTTVSVHVRGALAVQPWSFRNDVQTVLTKAGCNMGACHGAQAGKKGFKLALRGYDHFADYDTLTRQARARRVDLNDPAESLILRKATGTIPHGGGQRFAPGSLEYRIVSEWIAEGAPGPTERDPVVTSLTILPRQIVLDSQSSQQLMLQAEYSDGTVRDVTRWAKFTSTETSVATVDEGGRVTVAGHGETAVTVWFASNVAVAAVSVPYETPVAPEVFASSPRVNLIDDLVLDKLQRLQLPPSAQAGDGEFLRRAYLDTLGVLPPVDVARKFLKEGAADKRQKLIETLLARPEYIDYWSYKWCDLLLVSSKKLKGPAVWSFYSWIRDSVASNKPWDEFAREILTAQGSTLENGAANYFVLHKDPQLLSEATSVTFLGMSIACAKCHDHPLERWTLDDYYGMANLFSRVRMKDSGAEGESIVFPVAQGNVKHPTKTTPPIPRPLDGPALALDDPRDRRIFLADWLTARDNPYFARAIVNRVWANYMGRGLVEMVDDLRATNPATNDRLLNALAEDFEQHGYDLKHLIRTIMSSAAYQRSARMLPGNSSDDRFYSHYLVKRMPAEVLLDALSQVTGVPTAFPNYPEELRAMQLPDNNVASYFLNAFGRPAREFTCECERTEEPSVTQTLHLANGKTLNDKLKHKGGTLDDWLTEKVADAELIDRLYLAALTRYPTANERKQLLAVLAEAGQSGTEEARQSARRTVLEDICWAVMTSKEFLFVH